MEQNQMARIQFNQLKGFPPTIDDKVETEIFLAASNEIVDVIRSFGTLFTPVINDMAGNIAKIQKVYVKDCNKFKYLDDLIILNIGVDNMAANALLWLKRGLQLVCTFFENIYNDAQNTEVVKKHLQDAYEKTLKPYHGFIVQSTIKIIYSWIPTRSQLIGQGPQHDENMKVLSTYLPTMRWHLNRIDDLLKKRNATAQFFNI
uniref:Putative glycolipid transfer protein n=1 Tax=Haematobia irritans TaxID=7368 RepID=A0A1L8EAT9_HAEIR